MGKRKAGFRKPKDRSADDDNRSQKPYLDLVRENEKFDEYYKGMSICKEEEWDQFLSVLKSDLCASFRITPGSARGVARAMVKHVQATFEEMQPLPWYPQNLAWQLQLSRKDIRRTETYYKLHNYLINETENGTVSRQETVSMIPPLVLKVEPHHKVLDMCAAPGSKTAQLLEFLHAQSDAIPTGYVIANDVDNKRCYMLVHQAKRLNSPCLAVINHDSAVLPNMYSQDAPQTAIQFDRVLCDVPCSGDGTLRKNPDIWGKWTPANAINLHGVQSRIIRRGAELLRVGGRLVYSTCSLNPMENEAVIHRLLAETQGAFRLVDVASEVPGLVYNPGMTSWRIASRNLEFYDNWEDVDIKWQTTLRPQMFPPTPEDAAQFHLDRCIRILPHHQNTGAFFVAVLEKLAHITESEKRTPKTEKDQNEKPHSKNKKRRKYGFREDPFVFFKEDEEIWSGMKSFYEIRDDFDHKCLLVRCQVGKKKNVYMTTPGIRDLILHNQENVKFINSGVRAFVRSDNRNMKRCAFRIANDALESIFKFIGPSRKLSISKQDLIYLLENDRPEESPPITSLSADFQPVVEAADTGSCILHYRGEAVDNPDSAFHLADTLELRVSGWRGTNSLRVYMPECSVIHLLRLLGGDMTKYDKNKYDSSKVSEDGAKGDAANDDVDNSDESTSDKKGEEDTSET